MNYERTRIHKSQPNSLITLTFRSHHETFIRRSWYSVLPDLDATINCHIKKTVVGMTQLIAALIMIVIYEFLHVNRLTNQMNLFLERRGQSTSNLVDLQYISVNRHVLILSSKGQRSRSHSYQMHCWRGYSRQYDCLVQYFLYTVHTSSVIHTTRQTSLYRALECICLIELLLQLSKLPVNSSFPEYCSLHFIPVWLSVSAQDRCTIR